MTEQRKNLQKYIVPAMVGNLSFFILTIVDGMFVGNGVGPDALGAVSLAMPFENLIWACPRYSMMWGLASGLQPLYGASYGAKDDKSLRFYFKSGRIMAFAGGVCIFLLTFFVGKPLCAFFGADAASVPIVCESLPKYCLNYVFAASTAVIASYLFSTKRTQYAITINVCRSILFNFACINFLPLIFGYEFVWYTVTVSECICMVIAMVLRKISEKNGIIYR